MSLEDPPGFIVSTEAQKAAWENGFRIERGREGAWQRYASATANGDIWIAAASPAGPWFLSLSHGGVAAELRQGGTSNVMGPGLSTFVYEFKQQLHDAIGRAYRLTLSLPDVPLQQFRTDTASLPRSTEAERIVIQRVGQNIFRAALLEYWNGRCPITHIAEPELLRASHIVSWSECDTDEQRLDVHNGLLLSALWDAAFDTGIVSFADDGAFLFAPQLNETTRAILLGSAAMRLDGLTAQHQRNLEWHRRTHGF